MTEDLTPQDESKQSKLRQSAGIATISAIKTDHGIQRLLRNTFALALGRNLNALGRLVVASMIVRGLGAESFGIYSIIVALLAISDWILDFGTTDVFVREVVKDPESYTKVKRSLIALKLIQTPIAMTFMVVILLAMKYPEEVVLGGIIATLSIGFFAGVAVYRSIFNATLTMEREMLAEFVSVLALLPLVVLTIQLDFGTTGLMWSIFVSRAVFLLGCIFLAGGERSLSLTDVKGAHVKWLAKSSVVIGSIGLLFVVNNSVEIILLSNLSELADVAYFAAAQKLAWPIFMVLGSVGTSYYPVLAAQYPKSRTQFHRSCQQAFDMTVIGGGLAISGVYCGAQFLLSLLGADMLAATSALRILVIVCVFKSVSAVLGPTLFIVNAQMLAFRYFSIALVIKVVAIFWIAPIYGFLGTACITLATESLLITPITLFYVWRLTGFRPQLASVAAVVPVTVVSIATAMFVLPSESLLTALLAGAIYCALLFSFNIVDIDTIRTVFQRGARPA